LSPTIALQEPGFWHLHAAEGLPIRVSDNCNQEKDMKNVRQLLFAGALAASLAFAQTNSGTNDPNANASQTEQAPAKGSCDCPCCKDGNAQKTATKAQAKAKSKGKMQCKMDCCKRS
jgi:hypothetical protein